MTYTSKMFAIDTVANDDGSANLVGNTFKSKAEIKNLFKGVWNGDAKVWIIPSEQVESWIKWTESTPSMGLTTTAPSKKPSIGGRCSICGTHCYGDCKN